MVPLNDNESDPVRLWAEIHKLRHERKGPDGFATWYDAAVHERKERVKYQKHAAKLSGYLVVLLSEVWSYLHAHCTIESIKQHYWEAYEYVGRGTPKE